MPNKTNTVVAFNGLVPGAKKHEYEKLVNLYSVKDKVAEQFMPEFRSVNDLKAIQGFVDALTDEKSIMSKHAEEYELYKIGTFNEKTGEIISEIKLVTKGEEYVTGK